MLDVVREALLEEKERQEKENVPTGLCIDGFTNFVFHNSNGNVQAQGIINRVLKKIVSSCNKEQLENKTEDKDIVVLPSISCHILRHTFATRQSEAMVNVKVIQKTLGHSDVSTTMNIYVRATEEWIEDEFTKLDGYLKEKDI